MSAPLHEHAALIERVAFQLRGLAGAFFATGNRDMADRLGDMAETLTEIAHGVRDESFRISGERLRDAQQATANMLNAALAMAEKADKERT